MPDRQPHYAPGRNVSFVASAAVTGGQLVEITGNMTVAPAAAASTKVIGVAERDAVAGASLTVSLTGPVWDLTAAGAIAAGDIVAAAAAGAVAPIGAGTFGAKKGIALEAIANAGTGRVLLTP